MYKFKMQIKYLIPLMIIIFLLFPSISYAIPSNPTPFNITQPDDSVFQARQIGDEFYAWIETLDGYVIRKDDDDWWKYVDNNIITKYKVGKTDVKNLNFNNNILYDATEKTIKPTIRPFDVTITSDNQEVLVLLIQFPNKNHAKSSDDINNLLFSELGSAKSMHNYYDENSYGKLDLTGYVDPTWYTSTHNMEYYGADTGPYDNDPNTPDNGNVYIGELARELVKLADADIDFSQYDKNNDGIVDHLMIVHSGCDQADTSDYLCILLTGSNAIWSQSVIIPGGETLDGVQITSFTLVSEEIKLTVPVHEFGHDLGLPDLYDVTPTPATADSWGIGDWGLMGIATDINNPAGLSAWSKIYLNWTEPIPIETSSVYSLSQIENAGSKIYKININQNEYFLIENREKVGFDYYLGGEGILVWHIDDSVGEIKNNNVNADVNHKRVDLEEAHGGQQSLDNKENTGNDKDPWYNKCWWITNWFCQPYIFSQNSDPNSNNYNGNPTGIGIIVTSPPQETMNIKIMKPKWLTTQDSQYAFVEPFKIWENKLLVNLDGTNQKVTLDWNNSDQLTLTLKAPSGVTYSTSNPRIDDGITVMNASQGLWEVNVYGASVSNDYTEFTIKTKILPNEGGSSTSGDLGGIDFTSANLNFITTCAQGEGLKFVIKGGTGGQTVINISEQAEDAINDFKTGLVIPNWNQWITMDLKYENGQYVGDVGRIDSIFRETQTAAVLLDADVKLKFDEFGQAREQLQNEMLQYWVDLVKASPYWNELNLMGYNSMPRWQQRAFIHPDSFEVNGTDCEIFVTNTTMNVTFVFDWASINTAGLRQEIANDLNSRLQTWKDTYTQRQYNEVVSQHLYLINNDPKYADLKRTYASMALAQWYKKLDRSTIPMGDIIDSNNITGLEANPAFNKTYWDNQAYQSLYTSNGPCGYHGETCAWSYYGGVTFGAIDDEVIGNLSEQISNIINESITSSYSTPDNETYYFGGEMQTYSPDLIPKYLWFDSTVDELSDTINISAIIKNDGQENADNFIVKIYDKFTYPNGYVVQNLISEQSISVQADSSQLLGTTWVADKLGEHEIRIEIDSNNNIDESNELNNLIFKTVTIVDPYPEATINSPLNGLTFVNGEEINFAGYGTDFKDKFVNDLTWKSSLDGVIGNNNSFSKNDLSIGTHIITLTATDSDSHLSTKETGITILPEGYPSAKINLPLDEQTFAEGEIIYFYGSGYDKEDGTLTGSSLIWTSDIDNQVGTGESFVVSNLSVGSHVITLTATDSSGLLTSMQINIDIEEGTPLPIIVFPENNSQLFYGYPVLFNGTASDPQDGVLSENSLVWNSNIDGYLGHGNILNVSVLSEGTHTITLTATDKYGLENTTQIIFVITPAGYPTASIISPRNEQTFIHGNNITFIGSGFDAVEGKLTSSSLVWSSDIDGILGSGDTLESSSLSMGTHIITLNATNKFGKSAIVKNTIKITSKPPEATVSSPVSGDIVESGTSITFNGAATDLEDGIISSSSLIWYSDKDGQIGIGTSFSRSDLSAGSHKITLNATDSHGVSATTANNIIIAAPGVVSTNIFSDGLIKKDIVIGNGGGSELVYLNVVKDSVISTARLDITGVPQDVQTNTFSDSFDNLNYIDSQKTTAIISGGDVKLNNPTYGFDGGELNYVFPVKSCNGGCIIQETSSVIHMDSGSQSADVKTYPSDGDSIFKIKVKVINPGPDEGAINVNTNYNYDTLGWIDIGWQGELGNYWVIKYNNQNGGSTYYWYSGGWGTGAYVTGIHFSLNTWYILEFERTNNNIYIRIKDESGNPILAPSAIDGSTFGSGNNKMARLQLFLANAGYGNAVGDFDTAYFGYYPLERIVQSTNVDPSNTKEISNASISVSETTSSSNPVPIVLNSPESSFEEMHSPAVGVYDGNEEFAPMEEPIETIAEKPPEKTTGITNVNYYVSADDGSNWIPCALDSQCVPNPLGSNINPCVSTSPRLVVLT